MDIKTFLSENNADTYNHNKYTWNDEIVLKLMDFLPPEVRAYFNGGELIEYLYQLEAAAQNHYNSNFYRQFYNLLVAITETN